MAQFPKLKVTSALSGLIIILFSGCATTPYPYFDSAMNDHNRAPSSVALPAHIDVKDQTVEKVNTQAQADYLFLLAEMSALEGQSTETVSKLESVYEIDPSSSVVMHRLAMENYRAGKTPEALKWIDRALAKYPDKREINVLAASIYSSNKQYVKAEKIYKKLIQANKEDAEAHLYLAAIYSEQKKYALAISEFDRIIKFKDYEQKHLAYYYGARTKFESDRVKYFYEIKSNLRQALIEKPDYLEALQFLGQLIEKTEGKNKVFHFYAQHQKKHGPIPRLAEVLSQFYLETGDYDRAYEQLEIVETNTQDPIQVKLKMALILIDKKMFDKAILRLEELSAMVPESDKVKFYLGSLYQETKNTDRAILAYTDIQDSSKHYEDAAKNLATLYREQGQQVKAIDVLKKLVKDKPENVANHVALAQFLEDSKKYDEALALLNDSAKKFPKEAQIEYYIGTMYDKKNDKVSMLKHMHKAIELNPEFPLALNYIAYSLLEMNQDLPKAEAFALKAYSLDKQDPYIIDTVGWIYFQKADYVKSAEYLEKAHALMPDVSVIADHLGDAYVKLNKFEKAYELYQKAINHETDMLRLKQISIKISEIKIEQNLKRLPAAVSVKKVNPEAVSDLNKDEPE